MSLWRNNFAILAACLALVAGCSRDVPVGVTPTSAAGPQSADKDGSEALGAPSLRVAAGSGLSHGGVSLVGVASADLAVAVPANAEIRQVLLYWAGGSASVTGDDQISLDGVAVTGQLIGGPTWFYTHLGSAYHFSAYRADITELGLVAPGGNVLTVSGFDFTAAEVDENDGASILVIWDDGSQTGIQLRDGLDMAYFGFEGVLNETVPQTFAVTPADGDRLAQLVLMAASVGQDRPTRVLVTTTSGSQVFEDPMGGADGAQWDSVELPILIPAGVSAVTVQLVSTPGYEPRGASLGWVAAALSEPADGAGPAPWNVTGAVYVDTDRDGFQDASEPGLPGVAIDLGAALATNGGTTVSALTGTDGRFAFAVPAGSYVVELDLVAHPGSFNADLASSFLATGALTRTVTVGPDAPGNDFGFVPDDTRLLADIASGAIVPEGLTQGMWRQIFRCAILADDRAGQLDEVDGALYHGGVYGDDCGVEASRLFYDAATLRELLGAVTGLYLPVPFQFNEGTELVAAYKLLSMVPRDDDEALLQETLVTELNYVTGRAPAGRLDLLGALASWAESLLAWEDVGTDEKVGEKDRTTDVRRALTILEAVNTGGGGGVDE